MYLVCLSSQSCISKPSTMKEKRETTLGLLVWSSGTATKALISLSFRGLLCAFYLFLLLLPLLLLRVAASRSQAPVTSPVTARLTFKRLVSAQVRHIVPFYGLILVTLEIMI